MISFLRSPWLQQFETLVSDATSSLTISSPYVSKGPCTRIALIKSQRDEDPDLEILLLTDLSRGVLLSGVNDVSAIYELANTFRNMSVRFLPSVHAKVYIADEKRAIVTSGNLTFGGLLNNFEYGVEVDDQEAVRRIRADILNYAALATPVDRDRLAFFNRTAVELNDVRRQAEKSINKKLRREFNSRLQKFDEEIIRTRVAGRAPHAIFAEAILYLLSKKPLSTTEMHPLIQKIHPDLCDDNVERIIDGKHFGKKWKHAVRTAQQHLKRIGKIGFKNGVWSISTR